MYTILVRNGAECGGGRVHDSFHRLGNALSSGWMGSALGSDRGPGVLGSKPHVGLPAQ